MDGRGSCNLECVSRPLTSNGFGLRRPFGTPEISKPLVADLLGRTYTGDAQLCVESAEFAHISDMHMLVINFRAFNWCFLDDIDPERASEQGTTMVLGDSMVEHGKHRQKNLVCLLRKAVTGFKRAAHVPFLGPRPRCHALRNAICRRACTEASAQALPRTLDSSPSPQPRGRQPLKHIVASQ